ncbi:MAG: hypothetical protein NUV51_03950 [Sulfuricaulis sp.]|nr:hypothetical protein [Sulfuricaulis sp.]
MSTEDPGMLKQFLEWAWLLVLGLIGVVWHRQDARIDKNERMTESVISRNEFTAHEARDERDRIERREAERTLFDKIDALDAKIDAKLAMIFDRLMGGAK